VRPLILAKIWTNLICCWAAEFRAAKNAESSRCTFICLLCLHIETWCLNERLNEWIINKSFICLLILQKYIVWKLKIKIHDKLFYFLFQISTEILLKVIGKHFCIYLLIHCFQFLKIVHHSSRHCMSTCIASAGLWILLKCCYQQLSALMECI